MAVLQHQGRQTDFLERLAEVEYGLLLPGMAAWPLKYQQAMAALRALHWTCRGWEWRAWIGDSRVPQRTLQAFRLLDPSGSRLKHAFWLWRRNFVQAQEEQESAWIGRGRLPEGIQVEYVGLEDFPQPMPPTLLLTTHFASSIMGSAFLGRLGWEIDSFGSSVVRHPALPRAVRRHYTMKYRKLGKMHGGRVLLVEGYPKAAYTSLKRGRSLILLADMPPPDEKSCVVTARFMGQDCRFAQGALRLARRTGVPVAAYLVERAAPLHYRVHLHPPRRIEDGVGLQPVFDFFTAHMRKRPWAWWAVDLLPLLLDGGR